MEYKEIVNKHIGLIFSGVLFMFYSLLIIWTEIYVDPATVVSTTDLRVLGVSHGELAWICHLCS